MPLFGFNNSTIIDAGAVRDDVVALLKEDPTAVYALGIGDLTVATDDQIFKAFIKATDPSFEETGQGCHYTKWICTRYLESPAKGEDLYKIRENLRDFKAFSKTLIKDQKPNQIHMVKDFDHLLNIVLPYQQKREKRLAEKQLSPRFMTEARKKELLEGTTVFYDGPEGKIVLIHTPDASKFWGNQTKWCITHKDAGEWYFDNYSARHPVIMYLPVPNDEDRKSFPKYSSFKMASVDNLYDEIDKSNFGQTPECLKKLIRAAQKTLPKHQRDYLDKYGRTEELLTRNKEEVENNPIDDSTPDISQYPEEWQKWLKEIKIKDNSGLWHEPSGKIPAKLRHSKKFVLAAVQQYPNSLGYVLSRFRSDKDIVMAAVRRGYVLDYAAKKLQDDEEIILEAVKRDRHALDYASARLRNNKNIVLAAVHHHGEAIAFAPDKLCLDRDIALKAMETFPQAFTYLPMGLTTDKNFVLEALKQHGEVLAFAPDQFKNKFDVCLAAVQAHGDSFRWIPRRHQKDPKFIQKVITTAFHALPYLTKTSLDDTSLVASFLKTAIDSGQPLERIVSALRKIPALQGDAEALTNPAAALKKLQSLSPELAAKTQALKI